MRIICPSLLTYIIIMILTLVSFWWESCQTRRPMGWTRSERAKLGLKHWTIQVVATKTKEKKRGTKKLVTRSATSIPRLFSCSDVRRSWTRKWNHSLFIFFNGESNFFFPLCLMIHANVKRFIHEVISIYIGCTRKLALNNVHIKTWGDYLFSLFLSFPRIG